MPLRRAAASGGSDGACTVPQRGQEGLAGGGQVLHTMVDRGHRYANYMQFGRTQQVWSSAAFPAGRARPDPSRQSVQTPLPHAKYTGH